MTDRANCQERNVAIRRMNASPSTNAITSGVTCDRRLVKSRLPA